MDAQVLKDAIDKALDEDVNAGIDKEASKTSLEEIRDFVDDKINTLEDEIEEEESEAGDDEGEAGDEEDED